MTNSTQTQKQTKIALETLTPIDAQLVKTASDLHHTHPNTRCQPTTQVSQVPAHSFTPLTQGSSTSGTAEQTENCASNAQTEEIQKEAEEISNKTGTPIQNGFLPFKRIPLRLARSVKKSKNFSIQNAVEIALRSGTGLIPAEVFTV